MRVSPTFPAYASGNCDVISKRTDLADGDQVVVLDVDVDMIPSGIICLHSDSVKNMVAMLGWNLRDDAELESLQAELADAKARLTAFDGLLTAIQLALELESTPT